MLLHLINYNTYIMLRKAELWRLNELTTGDRGLIEKKKQENSMYKNVNPLPFHMNVSVHF